MRKRSVNIMFSLFFIAFAAGLSLIGMNIYHQIDRIEASTYQIQEIQEEITHLNEQFQFPTDQQGQLLEIEQDLDHEKSLIPTNVESNEVVREILSLGVTYDLLVIPLSTNDWSIVKIGANDYQQLTINFEITGSWESLIDFLTSLQNTKYLSLVCDEIKVTITPEKETQCNLAISLYTRS